MPEWVHASIINPFSWKSSEKPRRSLGKAWMQSQWVLAEACITMKDLLWTLILRLPTIRRCLRKFLSEWKRRKRGETIKAQCGDISDRLPMSFFIWACICITWILHRRAFVDWKWPGDWRCWAKNNYIYVNIFNFSRIHTISHNHS